MMNMINKSEAAALLGVSKRALERYAAAGRLPAVYTQGPTGRQVSFDPADVERLKVEREAPMPRPATSPDNTALAIPGKALAKLPPGGAGQLVSLLQALSAQAPARPVVPVADKLMLTLAEAAALTGLSRARLKAAIDAGQLQAVQIGRSRRVKRQALEGWIEDL
jgi:excisionase family DNA binding protein